MSDVLSLGEVCLYGMCNFRIMADLVQCVRCGGWIDSRCASTRRPTSMFTINFPCS